MRVLYLESPYSFLFRDLHRVLAPTWSHTFIFSIGYLYYMPRTTFTLVSRKTKLSNPSNETIENISRISSILNSNIKKPSFSEKKEMAAFHMLLTDFITKNRITIIFCHNDLRWQHAIAKQVAKELDIKVVFFEEGYFRPHTITADSSGVNAYSSLPRSPEFYLSLPSHQQNIQFKNFGNASNFQRIMRLVHFNIFLLLDTIGRISRLNCKLHNKDYSFRKYLKLFWNKLRTQARPKKLNETLPTKYIFIALQVSEDTQTVIHSPFSGTQEFITLIENTFESLPKPLTSEIKLVFKKHPMEIAVNYNFSDKSIISNNETTKLIEGSIGVILINSSTIAQCLGLKKPVITLGSSFFDISGLTFKTTPEKLSHSLTLLIQNKIETNSELYSKFLTYLKYTYQYNMNLYYYNNTDLVNFTKSLCERENLKT